LSRADGKILCKFGASLCSVFQNISRQQRDSSIFSSFAIGIAKIYLIEISKTDNKI
jgi:hypothetical protein